MSISTKYSLHNTRTSNSLLTYWLHYSAPSHLPVDGGEATGIPADHPGEDGEGGRGGLPHAPEVQGDADELLHLAVVLGSELLQAGAKLKLLVPA